MTGSVCPQSKVCWILALGIKRLFQEADHYLSNITQFKNTEATPALNYVSAWCGNYSSVGIDHFYSHYYVSKVELS
jgi:hypothetical protein